MIIIDTEETLNYYNSLKPIKKWKRTKVSCNCTRCNKSKIQLLGTISFPFTCKDCKHSITMLKPETQDKYKAIYKEKYGCEWGFQAKEIKDKIVETNVKEYGFASAAKNETIKNKMKETNKEIYGTEYGLQNEEVRNKIKETCTEKYGTDCYMKTDEMREKSKETMKENFGVEYTAQSKELRTKMENTCEEKYGVKHPYQNHDIYSNAFTKIYYDGHYFDSNWEVKYYDYLKAKNIDFVFHPKTELWYEFEGIKHRYYPDFLLVNENKLVEVKSDYLYKLLLIENTKDNAKYKLMKEHNVEILTSKELKVLGIKI